MWVIFMKLNFVDAMRDKSMSVDGLRDVLRQDLQEIDANVRGFHAVENAAKAVGAEVNERVSPLNTNFDTWDFKNLDSYDDLAPAARENMKSLPKLQKAAVIGCNYLDIGQYDDRARLVEAIDMGMESRPEVGSLIGEFVPLDEYDSPDAAIVAYKQSLQRQADQAETREFGRFRDVDFIGYAAQTLSVYGDFSQAMKSALAGHLSAEIQEFNMKHVVDEKLVPVYSDAEKQAQIDRIYAGYGNLYHDKNAQPLTQDAMDSLTEIMDAAGYGDGFKKYMKEHDISLLTPENEFNEIVARNERIANGLEVPEWVEKRDEQLLAQGPDLDDFDY